MARIVGFRKVDEKEVEIDGFKAKLIPHVVPVYVVWNDEGFAVIGFMIHINLETGETTTEVYVYKNTLPEKSLKKIAEKLAERI